MKKTTLLVFIVVAFAVFNSSYAQTKKNAIKIPVIGLLGGQYQLAYERVVSPNVTLNLSGGIIYRTNGQSWVYDKYSADITGFLVVPEARFYFKEAMKGMYLGAFVRYKTTLQKLTDESDDVVPGGCQCGTDVSRDYRNTSIGGGFIFGWQFLISDVLVIDMFVGPSFKTVFEDTQYKKGGVTNVDFNYKFADFKAIKNSPIGVKAGVSFGLAF